MTTEPQTPMTEAEARAFANKAEAWTATLEPKEQAMLAEILRRAAGEEAADIAGFSFGKGVATAWFTVFGAVLNAGEAVFSGGSAFARDGGPKY